MTDTETLGAAWDAAIERYRDLESYAAEFDTWLLESLRPQWEQRVHPGTSMYDLRFCSPSVPPFRTDEWVLVELKDPQTARGSLCRMAPRRGETQPAGPVTITGSVAKIENVLPMVEALLHQL